MKKLLFALLICSGPALANDISVNSQDQAVMLQICTIATKSPTVSIDDTAAIVQWCVTWRNRIKDASKVEEKK